MNIRSLMLKLKESKRKSMHKGCIQDFPWYCYSLQILPKIVDWEVYFTTKFLIISFHLNTWKTIQLFDWHKDNTNTSSWYLTLLILSENKNKMSIIYNKQWIKDISLGLYSWFHNVFSMRIITVQHNPWCVYQYLESYWKV